MGQRNRPLAILRQRPETDNPGSVPSIDIATFADHGQTLHQRRPIQSGKAHGNLRRLQGQEPHANSSMLSLQPLSRRATNHTIAVIQDCQLPHAEAPRSSVSSGPTGTPALANSALRRSRLKTTRLKKCMPPKTKRTRPSLEESASIACCVVVTE